MAAAKHTPGPFETDGLTIKAAPGLFCETRFVVATMGHFVPAPEREATAMLFAAAPELLESCRLAVDILDSDGKNSGSAIVSAARAAIAKATGSDS